MTRVRTGWSDIGSTRARTPSAAQMRAWASVRRAPSSSARARSMAMARSRSPRLNQTSTPSSRSPSMTAKVSPFQPPAALVDPVSQPEGDEIGVGGDVGAVDLDVVAGVGHYDQVVGTDHVEHPARQLRPAGPAGEHDDRARLGGQSIQARDLDSGAGLVAHVDRDEQRRELLDDPRHLQRPAVHRAQPVDLVHQLDDLGLVSLAVTADEDVLVEHVIEIGEQRGADGVKGRHDA